MGMDSLTSLELRRRLEAKLGCVLSSTVAFDHPTAEQLRSICRLGCSPPHRRSRTVRLPQRTRGPQRRRRPIMVFPTAPIAVVGLSCRFPGGTAREGTGR